MNLYRRVKCSSFIHSVNTFITLCCKCDGWFRSSCFTFLRAHLTKHTHTHTNAWISCIGGRGCFLEFMSLATCTQKYLCQFILDAQHVHTIYIRAHAHTRTHTSELISVQNEAAFEGCGEPVVDEPLNNSLGQAWKSFFHKTESLYLLCSLTFLFLLCALFPLASALFLFNWTRLPTSIILLFHHFLLCLIFVVVVVVFV